VLRAAQRLSRSQVRSSKGRTQHQTANQQRSSLVTRRHHPQLSALDAFKPKQKLALDEQRRTRLTIYTNLTHVSEGYCRHAHLSKYQPIHVEMTMPMLALPRATFRPTSS